MCITLYIIAPAQALPHCVHMVAQWHLPSHPLSSVWDGNGKWEMVVVATSNIRYQVMIVFGNAVSRLNPVTYDFAVS